MNFFIVLSVFALSQCVLSQEHTLQHLPVCAKKCLDATAQLSQCNGDVLACLCTDTAFMGAVQACSSANCTVVETMSATNTTHAVCGASIKSKSGEMIAVTTSFGALAVFMVTLRLIYRFISSKAELGVDDFLIALAGIASLFQNVPIVIAGYLGFGRDVWSISPDNLTKCFKWMYVTYLCYQIAEFFCQLSILAFYLRVMTDPNTRKTVYGLGLFVIGFGISNTFTTVLQCHPIHFFWDGWKGNIAGACTINTRLYGFIRGSIEICLDIAIITVPLPVLAKLQRLFKKKFQVMSMLCVGFVITVVSCLRIWSLLESNQSTNPTYDNVRGVYWCVTEANLFIVMACMPAIQSFLRRSLPSCCTGSSNKATYESNRKSPSTSGMGQRIAHGTRTGTPR